jgi:hypothetical protein
MSLFTIAKESEPAKLARHLSYPGDPIDPSPDAPIVLIELNHFFSHHCALPAIIRTLREKKNYRFVSYIPMRAWEESNTTLDFVGGFYESMGVRPDKLKASPTTHHFEIAKEAIIAQIACFNGTIWNLTDFELDGIPLGVYLVEILLQQFKSAEFDQSVDTATYSLTMIATYLWWKDYIATNAIECIIASHNCYEFALPQLAALGLGLDAYVWHDNYLFHSAAFAPLPLISRNWITSLQSVWEKIPEQMRYEITDSAGYELASRSMGRSIGRLASDPRFTEKIGEKVLPSFIEKKEGPAVLVYCHAFSDAPCTLPISEYGQLCSPLISTRKILEILSRLGCDVYIKTHPAPFPQDDEAISRLLAEFPNIKRLSSALTPTDVKEMGIDAVITGWGSICFEASYIGLPVIVYSPSSVVADYLPLFDLNDEHSLSVALGKALGEKLTHFERQKIIEAYACVYMGSYIDLTASNLDELPREGERGRYSPNAYAFWLENFSSERFSSLVAAYRIFFETGEGFFSRFSITENQRLPQPGL